MNDNVDNMLLFKEQIHNEAKSYAAMIAGRLAIPTYAGKAIDHCGDCKPCILAYLYAVYLDLEEKYRAILSDIKKSGQQNDYKLAWEKLREDNAASTKLFKDSQWRMILQELKNSTKTIYDLISELPKPPSPRGPSRSR